jgi:DNA polymerase theta
MIQNKEEEYDTNSPSHAAFQLPTILVNALTSMGISRLHDWQKECLLLPKILESNANLLYSAPTSAGKTLVAEILMVKRLVEERQKVIVILPFVSIVNELTQKLKKFYPDFVVHGYYGNQSGPQFEDVDVAICTIEKGNNLVNRLIEDNKLELLGTMVVDELHLIGNDSRGYLLELLITKIKIGYSDIKFIGMSATLPNIEVLSKWLNAQLYITEYRPVPLVEYIKIESKVYSKSGTVIRDLQVDVTEAKKLGDPDILIPIVHEVVQQGSSVLIFCAKKVECENCAKNVARLMVIQYEPNSQHKIHVARKSILDDLAQTPAGMDPVLALTVPNGVAYHHSGLTTEERFIIEESFRIGVINVICATSTLASGVNLPARRVIFRNPYIGRNFLDSLDYKQMKGRAGRFGLDTNGDSIIMCTKKDFHKCVDLIQSNFKPLQSCLGTSHVGMARAILEAIVNKLAESRDDVISYLKNTLLFYQSVDEGIEGIEACELSITYLISNGFLTVDERYDLLVPSALGVACVASSLDPMESVFLKTELDKCLSNFVLHDELHVVYQVTPAFFKPAFLDWRKLLEVYHCLKDQHKLVADCVGIHEGFLSNLAHGFSPSSKELDRFQCHIRFFNALILYDMIHEYPFSKLVSKYGMDRGSIQNLQSLCSTYAGMIRTFCNRLQYHFLDIMIASIQERLVFGVEGDLLVLSKIDSIDRNKARILYDGGFKTPLDIACFKEHFPNSIDSSIFKMTREIHHNAKVFLSNM